MNLLNIFKRYNAEDLEEENNQLKSVNKISPVEAWELEKITNPDADYSSWHTRTIVQNISDSLGKTIKIED